MLKKPFITFALFSSIFVLFELFFMRFSFTFPAPIYSCLHASVFIVDRWDKDFKKGDIVAFHFENKDDMVFGNRKMKFIKRVQAISGDVVNVHPQRTQINDEIPIELSMELSAHTLRVNVDDYQRTITIKPNSFFAMGETLNSYDSRYWGSVDTDNVIGKAYAIF